MDRYAVHIKNANKSYGDKPILHNLSMKVPKGCIYGLLGASGCGKTTLLSCVVGRKKLNSGELWVLGGKPGKPGSGVPGCRVGYMPQDIALVPEFTVEDAIFYFGRILNMPESLIKERFLKLKELLDLPPDKRFLKHCSGGQQRRVSFACAMIHKPELLILDEPTVGLDPVLRESIWSYLAKITREENIAVIITTHYIEEARQAHKIGLMRGGRLIAEETPDRLLALFNVDSLEEAFLILSRQQEEGRIQNNEEPVADNENNVVLERAESIASEMEQYNGSQNVLTGTRENDDRKIMTTTSGMSLNGKRLKSLFLKNTKQFCRNTSGAAFTFIFPILEILSFLFAVGGDVKNIPIGIINHESLTPYCENFTKNGTALPFSYTNCEFQDLGCRFIQELDDPMMTLYYYDNLTEAIEEIKHGNVVGVLYMSSNFSESFQQRLNDGRKVTDESLENSQIKVWLDMSNRQIGASIKYKLLLKYVDFQRDLFKDCKLFPKLAEIPIRYNYEFGTENETYTNFMIPGVLITIMFFLGTMLTSTIIITDRLEGVWDRSIVAGVSSLEIVLSHFAMQICLVLIQTFEVIILVFIIFGIEYIGNMWIIILYTLLGGLSGMVFGFFISVISDSHNAANVSTTGLFYPMILLCGMVWPVEAQPTVLRIFSLCLPFTLPIISLREVIKKDYGINHPDVLQGIGVTLLWILGLSIISIFAIKAKR